MLSPQRQRNIRPTPRPQSTWFERLMAAIALANLILVLLDLSYIRFRDVYLKLAPGPTAWYGQHFKGIEPQRTTENYLSLAATLEKDIAAQPTVNLADPRISTLLAQLRDQSVIIVDDNPFAVAGKSGTLERIKNLMRDRMSEDSSKAAFRKFWSSEYLNAANVKENLTFFDSQVRPLMQTNYFRSINESGPSHRSLLDNRSLVRSLVRCRISGTYAGTQPPPSYN